MSTKLFVVFNLTVSHFTRLESRFLNLDILKQSLSDLDVVYDANSTVICGHKGENTKAELVIHQSNGHDIGFEWTDDKGYDLVADLAFWAQPYSPDTFLGYLHQRYAVNVVLAQSEKGNLELHQYETQPDGKIRLRMGLHLNGVS